MADLLHGHAQVWLKQSSKFLDDDKLKSFYLFFFFPYGVFAMEEKWKQSENKLFSLLLFHKKFD